MRFMVGVMRLLPLYAVTVTLLLLGVNAPPAHAKLGPISIRSVYTTDENFNNKDVFAPGDTINYHVDVDNTTGSTFPIDIRFQVFANTWDPRQYSYDQTQHVDQMQVGLSRFYNPTTLPSDAAIYWYILRITITRRDCQGVDCANDWGESRINIQTTEAPKGGATTNLVVLVHGCCTDASGVSEWNALADEIKTRINPTEWEVVVWDWHEYTPTHDYVAEAALRGIPAAIELFTDDAEAAYQAAKQQGPILAEAIKIHSYKHVHFIGHSAGAKLIHEAATAYISDYFIRQENPFIHLTFLDAYTPNEWDSNGKGSYGSLPVDYPNHYSEHYVDKTTGELFPTDADLTYAFNFDITDWIGADKGDFGHQWPRYWYKQSVSEAWTGCGFALSLEGGNNEITTQAGASGSLKLERSDCIGDVPPPPSPTPRPTPTPPPLQ